MNKRILHSISIIGFTLLSLTLFTSCKVGVMGPTSEAASTNSYSGIQSIDQIRATSVRVSWAENSNARFYFVYDGSIPNGKVLGTFIAPASNGVVTGLTPSTQYTLLVRYLDAANTADSNTVTQSVTTLSIAEDAAKYPALSLSPSPYSLALGNSVTFTATGGTPPYTYLLTSGAGNINGSTGLFTAPLTAGTATIRVVDATQNSVDSAVTIVNSLSVSPLATTLSVNNSVEITATGGVSPLSFSVTSGKPFGSLGACSVPSSTCSKFTTAASLGALNTGIATIQITDAVGNYQITTLTLNRALTLGPSSATVGMNQMYTFFANYGAPPYTYSLTGSGSITSQTGIYTAPAGAGGPYTIQVTDSQNNTATASVTVAGASSFGGIDTITQIGSTSVNLNWTTSGTAASYRVYRISSGVANYLATQTAPATSTTVTGLQPATQYTFRVRAMDAQGNLDSNTRDVTITTSNVGITHNGWYNIKSLGAITPVSQATGLTSSNPTTTITWNAMTPSSGTIQSYNIYRATSSGGQNFTTPLATGLSTSYTDSSVVAGTSYYYVVQPLVNGVEIYPAPGNHPLEIKVTVPPPNMVLVHRWIANQEMCGLLQSLSDPTNNYRCAYTGLGGNGTYFDLAKSFFIDRVEMGCNYTPPNATAALSCGSSTDGCLGTVVPSGTVTGNRNDVYYNRATGVCYINTSAVSGTTWTTANTASLSAAQRALLATNSPGLPPLVFLDQNRSWETCQAFTDGTFGTKRLPTHKEQILAAAWDPSLSDSAITTMESGTNLPTTGNCNSNSANGLTYDNNVTPANLETISGTLASTIKSTRTGGTSTANCVSRYGVRDYPGNVWEFSSDQLSSCSATTHTCTGATSTLDSNNSDLNGFNFDGIQGPGGGSSITNWLFSAMSFNATRFIVPLGLPVVTGASASYGSLAIGTGPGQFDPAKFHGDSFYLTSDGAVGVPARGTISGGSWGSGSSSGRFLLYYQWRPIDSATSGGLRCTFAAE